MSAFASAWMRPAEPPRCVCGHRDDQHADLASPRARWPRRCQAPQYCGCTAYREPGAWGAEAYGTDLDTDDPRIGAAEWERDHGDDR